MRHFDFSYVAISVQHTGLCVVYLGLIDMKKQSQIRPYFFRN